MKKIKEFLVTILVLAVIGSVLVWVYRNEKSKVHANLARRIAEINPRGGVPQGIDGLRAAIAAYEQQIELNVKEGAQTGAYWKILAFRLAEKKLHQQALEALEHAIYYNAEDPALFHLTGESASIIAASSLGFSANDISQKTHFTNLAESAYLRAIALDPAYAKPRLGLGIMYTFDLNRPQDAVPHLERYLELMSNDVRGMFVLARAYYMAGKFDSAVEVYDRIIARTKNSDIKAEAQKNKDMIRNSLYG